MAAKTLTDCQLTQHLTRSVASDDFDEVLLKLPAFQQEIEERLAAAANHAEREDILTDTIEWHRRWTTIAQSLRADMASQLRSLEVESRYAEASSSGQVFDTLG